MNPNKVIITIGFLLEALFFFMSGVFFAFGKPWLFFLSFIVAATIGLFVGKKITKEAKEE